MDETKSYVTCVCANKNVQYKIDEEDYDRVSGHRWVAMNSGVYTYIDGVFTSLSHFLVPPKGSYSKVLRKNGDAFDYRKSNLYCGNIYRYCEDCCEVECFDGRVFKIDDDCVHLVQQYQWHIDKNNYVITKTRDGRVIKLHRLLMDIIDNPEFEVDHINRDTLDNTTKNLRLSSRSLNCYNRDVSEYNSSGKIGVYRMSGYDNKWCAQINCNGERHYLGSFDSFEDAKSARISAELKYYGT